MMKVNQILKYKLLILFAFAAITGSSKDQLEKTKTIEKSYSVNASTILRINNKFGEVKINSWDKNEFAITVEIIGRGRNEEKAQRIIDDIDIDIDESSSQISFSTKVEKMKNKNDEGFEVNYRISMPESNMLEIKNSFGDVSMGDRSGDLELNISYGSLKVGDVTGRTSIKLSFGSGSINSVVESEMNVKYSKFELERATNVDMVQGFSNIEIGEVDQLELESKYGEVEIEKANIIDAEVHFSGFDIEELTGQLELESSYIGSFQIGRLAKSFTLIDIEGKFGSYEIGLEPGLNADIEAEFNFADLKLDSDVDATFNYKVKESNKSIYRGKIGAGDSSKRIKVESSYGNLRLEED